MITLQRNSALIRRIFGSGVFGRMRCMRCSRVRRTLVSVTGKLVSHTSKLGSYCGRRDSDPQGRCAHWLPGPARLPISPRPRPGLRGGWYATFNPPTSQGQIGIRDPALRYCGGAGRSRTGLSRTASPAADRSPTAPLSTSGQECNTAPGRFCVIPWYGRIDDRATLFAIVRISKQFHSGYHHIGVRHAKVQTQEAARPRSDACETHRPMERGCQARARQETPEAWLAEAQEIATSKKAHTSHRDHVRLGASKLCTCRHSHRAASSGGPRSFFGYAPAQPEALHPAIGCVQHTTRLAEQQRASSTYFRRNIRFVWAKLSFD